MSQYLCVGGDLDGWVVVLKEDQDSISFGDEKSRKTYVVYSCPLTDVGALGTLVPDGLPDEEVNALMEKTFPWYRRSTAMQSEATTIKDRIRVVAREIAIRHRLSETEIPLSSHAQAVWVDGLQDAIAGVICAFVANERERIARDVDFIGCEWNIDQNDNMDREANIIRRDAAYDIAKMIRAKQEKGDE